MEGEKDTQFRSGKASIDQPSRKRDGYVTIRVDVPRKGKDPEGGTSRCSQ